MHTTADSGRLPALRVTWAEGLLQKARSRVWKYDLIGSRCFMMRCGMGGDDTFRVGQSGIAHRRGALFLSLRVGFVVQESATEEHQTSLY